MMTRFLSGLCVALALLWGSPAGAVVAHSANANGGNGLNASIEAISITQASQTINTITIAASTTTCIIFIEYNSTATTTGWTIAVGGSAASLIASSSFTESTGAVVSIIAFEVKNPPTGAQAITGLNSGAAFAGGGIQSYVGAQSFTGSDTVNPSVAFGNASGTSVATATTNSSGSSIPSTDKIAAWFANASGNFGTTGASYAATGGTGLTFVDRNDNITNNSAETFASGNGAAVTMTATQGSNDGFAALGIWVKVPAAAGARACPKTISLTGAGC
jgi:hypothetical protein